MAQSKERLEIDDFRDDTRQFIDACHEHIRIFGSKQYPNEYVSGIARSIAGICVSLQELLAAVNKEVDEARLRNVMQRVQSPLREDLETLVR